MTPAATAEDFYRDMPIKDRAALATHFVAEKNDVEEARIDSSVHPELADGYAQWRQRFMALVMNYGLEHFKMQTRLWQQLYARDFLNGAKAQDKRAMHVQRIREIESELLALDRALERFCPEHTLQPADIRRIAGVRLAYAPIYMPAAPDAASAEGFYRQFQLYGGIANATTPD